MFLRFAIASALSVTGLSVALAADYHVSSSAGDDTASGLTATTAWRTLARAAGAPLAPGDRLRLRSGDRFQGELRLAPRGEPGREIVIEPYGEGHRPVIDGQGAEAAVLLIDPSHVTVRGLELTNEQGHYGVWLTGQNQSALGQVTLENLDLHHIYSAAWKRPADDGHGPYKYYGGINAQILRGERPTWWEALVVRGNTFHDLGTCGLSIGSEYPLHENRRRDGQEAFPLRGVLVERNIFRDLARDGAILRQCVGAIVRHNDVIRTGRVSMANGLWFWDCQDSVLRDNLGTGCGVRGLADGGPFSIDYNCTNCVVEYNYSHDNEGPGFMAFGNGRTGRGSVFRGNVSYNDATAPAKPGFAAVTMISALGETLVEGNLVIAGPATRVLLGHHDRQGLPFDVTYRANTFVGNGRALVDPSALVGGRFEGNLFVAVPDLPAGVAATPEAAARAWLDLVRQRAEATARAGSRGLLTPE